MDNQQSNPISTPVQPPITNTTDVGPVSPVVQPAQTITVGGPEGGATMEIQPKRETLTNTEVPPFIKDMLSQAENKQRQAQTLKDQGNLAEAVQMQESVLQELSQLARSPQTVPNLSVQEPPVSLLTPQEPKAPLASSEQKEENILLDMPDVQHNFGEYTISEDETTNAVELAPQPAERISEKNVLESNQTIAEAVPQAFDQGISVSEHPEGSIQIAPEPSMDHETTTTPPPTEMAVTSDNQDGRQLALHILEGIVQKLQVDEQKELDRLTVADSEEALYRIIEKDVLEAIRLKLQSGNWGAEVNLDYLASKLGVFAAIEVLRELKKQALDDSSRYKIQQAVDYLMNEYDRIEIGEAKSHEGEQLPTN